MTPANPLTPGTLYVVATPIGNLGDFSPRAQQTLAAVSAICAEDTRTTGALLSHFGISRPMVALHEHNEGRIAAELVRRLAEGQTLALVSDAGTPLVSDPGYPLVCAVRDAGLAVSVVPGPCAVTAALCMSGLATDEFSFVGFLPHKRNDRLRRLKALASETRTLVFYETPHRILEAAEDFAASVDGQRQVFAAREISKKFEESARMPVADFPNWVKADENRQRGEYVLVLEGAKDSDGDVRSEVECKRFLEILLRELPPSRAARVAAELLGLKRGPLYELALQIKPNSEGQA